MTVLPKSKVRFTAHQTFSSTDGHFEKWSGKFLIDREDLAASKMSVSIDAKSIDTDNGSRDDHLRNEDFFHVTKFPKIRFESTKVEPKKGGAKVTGRLVVKDKTKVVSFDITLKEQGDELHAYAQLTLNRYDLGLTYEAPFYAPALKKNVNVVLDVKLRAPPSAR